MIIAFTPRIRLLFKTHPDLSLLRTFPPSPLVLCRQASPQPKSPKFTIFLAHLRSPLQTRTVSSSARFLSSKRSVPVWNRLRHDIHVLDFTVLSHVDSVRDLYLKELKFYKPATSRASPILQPQSSSSASSLFLAVNDHVGAIESSPLSLRPRLPISPPTSHQHSSRTMRPNPFPLFCHHR